MRNITLLLMVLFAVLISPDVAIPQTVTETQAISFGEFFVKDNNSPHDLTVTPAGSTIPDAGFVVISSGQNSAYDVSGFATFTTLIIMVSSGSLTKGGVGEPFSLVNPVNSPSSVVTDGAGNASFTLGLTLRTSGTTSSYTDGTYNGSIDISVNA